MYIETGASLATCTANSKANAWASAPAAPGMAYQLLGFSGGASGLACNVQLLYGTTLKWQAYVGTSAAAISEWYGDAGPICPDGQALVVHTKTHAGIAKQCYANLIYRIVLQ